MEYVIGGENSLRKGFVVGGNKIVEERWLEFKEGRGIWLKF